MVRALLALALCGCFDTAEPAPPDAACTMEPSHGCCDLLPDVDAVKVCLPPDTVPNTCTATACWHADCSLTTITVCAP